MSCVPKQTGKRILFPNVFLLCSHIDVLYVARSYVDTLRHMMMILGDHIVYDTQMLLPHQEVILLSTRLSLLKSPIKNVSFSKSSTKTYFSDNFIMNTTIQSTYE